ncbi:hypothetical protein NDU88_001107 [Pleurodeles waltl]|uniref:Uncharacterized protein n=1 Tax=Pleurodeles waltl TaxID=8319 RepID=A0AAV7U8D6_PLEWA|nr:hypothetical protein NDU88_001107 [Pleurodeles waltl]
MNPTILRPHPKYLQTGLESADLSALESPIIKHCARRRVPTDRREETPRSGLVAPRSSARGGQVEKCQCAVLSWRSMAPLFAKKTQVIMHFGANNSLDGNTRFFVSPPGAGLALAQ